MFLQFHTNFQTAQENYLRCCLVRVSALHLNRKANTSSMLLRESCSEMAQTGLPGGGGSVHGLSSTSEKLSHFGSTFWFSWWSFLQQFVAQKDSFWGPSWFLRWLFQSRWGPLRLLWTDLGWMNELMKNALCCPDPDCAFEKERL